MKTRKKKTQEKGKANKRHKFKKIQQKRRSKLNLETRLYLRKRKTTETEEKSRLKISTTDKKVIKYVNLTAQCSAQKPSKNMILILEVWHAHLIQFIF